MKYDLVLGAGGIKGRGHIGVVRAIDDLAIPIDKVTCVSVGALVGTMYTNGRKSDEIRAVFFELRELMSRLFDGPWPGISQSQWQDILAAAMRVPHADPLVAISSLADLMLQIVTAGLNPLERRTRRILASLTRIPTEDPLVAMRSLAYLIDEILSDCCPSLEGPWQRIIASRRLCPNERLQLLAFDERSARPVLFKGINYRLAQGVAASGSVKGLVAPVNYQGYRLIDGATYHYNPTEFSKAPAIVVRLMPIRRWPQEPLNPLEAYLTWRALYMPYISSRMDVDSSRHIVIDLETPDVSALAFGTSEGRCRRMEDDAYETAHTVLSQAIHDGRLLVPGRRIA